MSERIPCQSAGCPATILPATALKTGGICMPCHQKKLAAEREAYILQNRKDVDRYHGITDPVEILKIMHMPRKYNPLERELPYPKSIRELYHQLTEAEQERLETYAISLMDEEEFDQAETILLSLMCFANGRIERGVRAFFLKEKYYPGIHQNGRKRLLFHPESYHFDKKEPIQSAAVALQTDEQTCPWCHGQMTVLLDFNLQDPLVQFLELSGHRLRIAACMNCNCYGTVYTKVGLDGSYSWSEYNTIPDYLPEPDVTEEQAWHTMGLSRQRMGTYEGGYWMVEAPTSQIGGHPSWIQDAEFPACPCCSETMMFTGQIDMEHAADSEGIFHAFLCHSCLITAVNYQQT